MQSRQLGFSLLEILVAFAIAAMALGMLYRVSGNNARQIGNLDQHERAMLLAQGLLAAHETVPPAGLNDTGQAAGYAWQVQSHPYPTPANSASPQAARLHEVVVDVAWSDGTAQRSFELTSLRPERKPRPGEVIR
ncbi:MAG: prepilin-type N-terminal cleavage/methylation domain-containing protein [Burkholderiaceae bacterium]